MLIVILGLPISLICVKVFLIGYNIVRGKFPYEVGGKSGHDIKNYLLSLIITFILLGIFIMIPMFYLGYVIYQFIDLLFDFDLTIWLIVSFSVLQVIYLRLRSKCNNSLLQLVHKDINSLYVYDGKEFVYDDFKRRFNVWYLVIVDILFIPIFFILTASYISNLIISL